jgi:hypothetical protein
MEENLLREKIKFTKGISLLNFKPFGIMFFNDYSSIM